MDFYNVIESRNSIKQYKTTPIDRDKVSRMINSAMMAPSWKNNTSYKFILISDENERTMLAGAVANDNNEAANAIKQAPMTAVVVADPNDSGKVNGQDIYLVDTAIAMEHFILSATNEGYGTCWIAAMDENKVKSILSIPNNYRVVGMTPIGESAENATHKPKKEVRDYIYLNNWGNTYTENDKQLKM